jgi:hypothetical protein
VTKDKGVRVPIDPKAVPFLLGVEMDYKVEKLSAQFIFNNPNQTAPWAAANRSSSNRRAKRRSAGNLTMMATLPGQAVWFQDWCAVLPLGRSRK